MVLENEQFEAGVIIHEDKFNRSSEPVIIFTENELRTAPNRDPHGFNAYLKVGFDDIIGEPSTMHSFDKVWIGSNAVFELVKYTVYRSLTLILAIPMSFVAGILFAILSCLHIWVAVPVVRSGLMFLPTVQKVWNSLTSLFVAPLFQAIGKCVSSINVKMTPI